MRFFVVLFCCSLVSISLKAQNPATQNLVLAGQEKTDTLKTDTLRYHNKGREAGRIAVRRSMILPGLGQVYNYGLVVDDVRSGRLKGSGFGKKLAIVGKIGAIYVAGTMLTLSYIDNNKKYHMFLKELQYRQLNNNQPDPNGPLAGYRDLQSLYDGKAVYKNNREVVLLSLGLTYGINIIDAYVTARLNYLNVDERLALKISPTLIPTEPMYGYALFNPGLKLTLKL